MLLSLHKLSSVLFLTFLFSAYTALGQTVVYVTSSGAGDRSGASWGNALSESQLQARLATATAGTQFWVAGGTYKPTTGMDRNVSFSLRNNVEVYGGFAGTESRFTQRPTINNTSLSSTTLTGDIGIAGNRNDNTYNVFRNTGLNATAVLDGVVIRDGAGAPFGGGMFNNGSGAGNGCSPTIRNCLFTQNTAEWGGAVVNYGRDGGVSSPAFTDCVFLANQAFGYHGGAVYNDAGNGTSSSVFSKCLFIGNQAGQQGGAIGNNIFKGVCNLVLSGCQFSQNSADAGGAIMFYSGQAVSTPIIENCLFTQNVGTSYGGAIYVTLEGTCLPTFVNCTITKNSVNQISN